MQYLNSLGFYLQCEDVTVFDDDKTVFGKNEFVVFFFRNKKKSLNLKISMVELN